MKSSVDIDTDPVDAPDERNDQDDGGGTVTFTSAARIDGEFGEANNLTIDAGKRQVLFNNDIGNNVPIGSLTITGS